MRTLLLVVATLVIFSCGKSGNDNNGPIVDPTNPITVQDKEVVKDQVGVDLTNLEQEPVPLSESEQVQSEKVAVADSKELKEFAKRTDKTIDFLINQAVETLKAKGRQGEAAQLLLEYQTNKNLVEKTYFLYLAGDKALGDHKPLSDWLAEVYNRLEGIFGAEYMKVSRLEHIKIINYGVPVTFQPRGDSRNNDKWDINEYRLHFVPLSGVATFWTVWTVCVGTTSGAINITAFVCIAPAEASRIKVEKDVAPYVSDVVYKEANLGPK